MLVAATAIDAIQFGIALAGLVSGVAAVVGVVLLKAQLEHAERQNLSNASRFCYEEMSALLGVLIEHPELRPYIYESKPCPEEDSLLRQQILALAGRYADFFEAIIAQAELGSLSKYEYDGMWKAFILKMMSESNVIQQYVREHPDYYSPAIRQLAA